MTPGETEPIWEQPSRTRETRQIPFAYEGARIAYQLGNKPGDPRTRALPWTFEEDYIRIADEIGRRPVYRAMEKISLFGTDEGEKAKEIWRGSQEAALKRFPLPNGRQSPSSDLMLPYYADSDQIFETRRWWETKPTDFDENSWERCDDPRRLPGVLRTFEQMNRR